jgi:hypothetical protein
MFAEPTLKKVVAVLAPRLFADHNVVRITLDKDAKLLAKPNLYQQVQTGKRCLRAYEVYDEKSNRQLIRIVQLNKAKRAEWSELPEQSALVYTDGDGVRGLVMPSKDGFKFIGEGSAVYRRFWPNPTPSPQPVPAA